MPFCVKCGAEITSNFCTKCGAPAAPEPETLSAAPAAASPTQIPPRATTPQQAVALPLVSEKSRLVLLILYFFLCTFSAHRFYAGRIKSALLQITLGAIALGSIVMIDDSTETTMTASDYLLVVLFLSYIVWLGIDFLIVIFGGLRDGDGNRIKNWTGSK